MDMTVGRIWVVVIAKLREAGYRESTIEQFLKTITALTTFVEGNGGAYTPALGAVFAAMTTSPRTGRFSAQRRADYTRLVALFDSYVHTGSVDLSIRGRGGGGRYPESAEFAELNTAWEADMAERGLAPTTREAYGRIARRYLVFLQDHGTDSLDTVDSASVTGFLRYLVANGWATTSLFWVVSNFRPFLIFIGRNDLVDAVNLAGVKRSYAILPVLDDDEEERVVRTCTSGAVTPRDAAITLLTMATGVRACDLAAMRLVDVDWRTQTINIVQQKTGNPATLPMQPLVTSMLADYVLSARPDSTDDHVFLRVKAPHTRLTGHASIYKVTARVFHAAGVVRVTSGTRLLRHNAASRLLRAGVPLPTISAVLGHADPDSTNLYMSVDEQHLLECVLPVPACGSRS